MEKLHSGQKVSLGFKGHINSGRPCGILVKVLDCSLEVSEFKLQLHY